MTGCNQEDRNKPETIDKPNILLILVDDMGYGDLQSYNPESKIPTPKIDGLAEEGIRFTNAHAPGALCHPSRYGLMTGRYPYRTNVNVWPEKSVIGGDRMTIASLLKEQGYHTAMVGKWHLGFDESVPIQMSQENAAESGNNTRAAYRTYEEGQVLSGGPVDRGFDSFFGIRASTDIPPYFYIRDDRIVNPPSDSIGNHYSGGIWTDIQGAFWREGGISPELDLADVLPRFTEESIGVVKDHRSSSPDQPLFLYVAFPSPHTPWLPSEEFKDTSGAGMYGDFMAMVDSKIGEILSTFEQEGMTEETLVIFTSDNGPVWYGKDKEQFNHDSQGGLRGMKGDAFEAGHRMPFIVKWPGKTGPGTVSEQPISFTDLLATFADITNTSLPNHAGEDSFSILKVLTGDQPENELVRPPVVSVSARGFRSIQNNEWKLIDGLGSGGFTDPSSIEPEPGGPRGQLYNLKTDQSETTNVWSENEDVVEHFKSLLKEWDDRGRSRE